MQAETAMNDLIRCRLKKQRSQSAKIGPDAFVFPIGLLAVTIQRSAKALFESAAHLDQTIPTSPNNGPTIPVDQLGLLSDLQTD